MNFTEFILDDGNTFKATISCNGFSAESAVFSLSISKNKEDYKNVEKCLCKKATWTADDLKYIVTQLRKKDIRIIKFNPPDKNGNRQYLDKNNQIIPSTDRGRRPTDAEKLYLVDKKIAIYDEIANDNKIIEGRLFYLNRSENLNEIDKSYEKLVEALNFIFKELDAKKCINKIHIFCQIYHETERLGSCYEADASAKKSGEDFYKGRGLIMITSKSNYKSFYEKTYKKIPSDTELEFVVSKVAKELDFAKLTSSWYLKQSKIKEYFNEEISVLNVSACINRPKSLIDKKYDEMNGIPDREKYFDLLKQIFDYENCK